MSQATKTFIEEALEELDSHGLKRNLRQLSGTQSREIIIEGKKVLNFCSNNYLGLADDPRLGQAAAECIQREGFGSGASRLVCGNMDAHRKLEEGIAAFKGTEDCLVFSTGYMANVGIISSLFGRDDIIFSDRLNHASIIDGIRLSQAQCRRYAHRDMHALESMLKSSGNFRKRGIITDSVFSMDGDIAPLKEIVLLSDKYNALVMIDDAHATGVLGERGRGGLEHFGITSDRIIQMGTLSKAMGCYGGFAAGTREMVDLLTNKARSFIYSTSLPPALCEAGIKAIDIIDHGSKGLRKRLWKNRERLFRGLNDLGFDTLDSETPIIPVIAGSTDNALKLARRLYRNRIFVSAIRPPTVPEGKCRLRFSVTAGHTNDDIDLVLGCLSRIK